MTWKVVKKKKKKKIITTTILIIIMGFLGVTLGCVRIVGTGLRRIVGIGDVGHVVRDVAMIVGRT